MTFFTLLTLRTNKKFEAKFSRLHMLQLRLTVQCGPTKYHTNCLIWSMRLLLQEMGGGVKGARQNGWGKDLLVRPPGRGMLSTLTRAKVHSDLLGQSVPDVVNDTLLDPDLTRALCILHYQTPGSLKLHYLHPSSPPRKRKRRVRGEEKGQRGSWPKPRTEGAFSFRSGRYSAVSSPSHSFLSPSLFLFFLLPAFCAGNLLNITTPESTMEHPRRFCPQGFLGRY